MHQFYVYIYAISKLSKFRYNNFKAKSIFVELVNNIYIHIQISVHIHFKRVLVLLVKEDFLII